MISYFYMGFLSCFYIGLSLFVIAGRRRFKVSLGDAGQFEMIRYIRIHANFSEYVPMALLLIYVSEMSGATPAFVHSMALLLCVGRALHAYGLYKTHRSSWQRFVGTNATFAVYYVIGIRLMIENGDKVFG